MAKPYYTEFASHALRHFARNQDKLGQMKFQSPAEMMNWNACIQSFAGLSVEKQQVLLHLYQEDDTFPRNVHCTAKAYGIPDNLVWGWNDTLLELFAKNRGLI